MRAHDPQKNAERLRKLAQEGPRVDPIQKAQQAHQQRSRPMQAPGTCRVCRKSSCNGTH